VAKPGLEPDLTSLEGPEKKIAVQQCSPSNLAELERICREEWEKLPKYKCAKIVASYPRRIEAVIAVKGASTKY
jgi:hypothetical protein